MYFNVFTVKVLSVYFETVAMIYASGKLSLKTEKNHVEK